MVRKVITSGYSYSGSSALFDFLTDYKGVAPFPGGEFRIMRASRGINMFLKKFKLNEKIQESDIDLFRDFCRGEGECVTKYDPPGNNNIIRLRKYFGKFFDDKVDELISGIYLNLDNKAGFLEYTREFITSLVNKVAEKEQARYVILDQAVRPWSIHNLRCFDSADVYIVRRDLRDQIVDRHINGFSSDSEFLDETKKRLASTDKNIKKLKADKQYNVHSLWFEDFILNIDEEGRKILKNLNISEKNIIDKPKFNPNKSSANIGIYRKNSHLIEGLDKKYEKLFYNKAIPVFLPDSVSSKPVSVKASISGENNKIIHESQNNSLKYIKVKIIGDDNEIQFGEGFITKKLNILVEGSGIKIIFGKKCNFIGKITAKGNNNHIKIGDKTTCRGAYLLAAESTNIEIGEDCMFSSHIMIRTTDAHSIIDIKTGERTNKADHILIGNHVWIGMHTIITRGSRISNDSVIATRAVVTKKFEKPNCTIGGIPAKILSEGITWSRKRI